MKKLLATILLSTLAFTMSVFANEEPIVEVKINKSEKIVEADEDNSEMNELDYQELNYENHKNDVAVFYDTDQSQCKHEHMEYDNYMSYEGEWYVGVSEYCPSCGYFNDNYNNSKHILEEPATEEDATEEGESNV